MALDDRLLDAQLPIDRAAAGDEDAFVLIMQRMTPLIHAQIHRYGGSGEQEDLGQEALLGLLAAVRSYRPDAGASFTTYATACIRHRLLSVARCTGSRTLCAHPLDEELDLPDDAGDPALLLQQQEEAEALLQRLRQRLTPLEYQVLLLRLGDCSYQEIALRLHIRPKAVDNAVQRLRRKLSSPL